MAMEWVILIGLASLGVIIVQTIYQANAELAKSLHDLHGKVNALQEKLEEIETKLDESTSTYVNPIDL
jgi:hypothetical protein